MPDYHANVSQERARLLKVQADVKELELAEMEGRLIPMEDVAAVWERLAGDCRAKFINLPGRLAPQIVCLNSIGEVKEVLERAIFECLAELAAGASVSKGLKGIPAASSSSGKRVGRPRKASVAGVKRRAGGMDNSAG